MDPKIQEIFDRLGIKLESTAAGLGKLSAATKDQVKSATAQALAQAKAHKDLLKSIDEQLAASGKRGRASKQELEAIAKKIKQEEELFDQAAASAKQQKDLDDKRTDGVKKLLKDLGSMGSSAVGASSSFYASDKAFTAVSGTLDLMGSALKATIEAAGLALSGVTVLGFSAGRATEGLGKLAIAAIDVGTKVAQMQLEMTQGYTDAFDKLAMTGMTFGGNISNMAAAAHAAGIDLRTYSQFVVRNVDALSQMGGTVEQASTRILRMGRAAIDGNNKMLMLYGGVDGVNDALAGYEQLLAKTGYNTVTNQEKVTAGSSAYLTNLKLLSELTGKDVKTLQKEQDDAMRDLAFRQKMRDIQEQDPKKFARIMQDVSLAVQYGGKEVADQLKEKIALDGDIISADQIRMQAFNGAADNFTTAMFNAQNLEGDARMAAIKQAVTNYQTQFAIESQNKKELIQLGQYAGTEFTKRILEQERAQMDTQAARLSVEKSFEAVMENIRSNLDADSVQVAELKKDNIKGRIDVDKVIAANVEKVAVIARQLTDLQTGLITAFGPTLTDAVNQATEALLRLAGSVPGGKKTTTGAEVDVDYGNAAVNMDGVPIIAPDVPVGAPAPVAKPGTSTGATVSSKGLKLKAGAEEKGKSEDKLYAVAKVVAEMMGGDYKYFSGLRDRDGDSSHSVGRAFDLVLNDPAKYADALAKIKKVEGVDFAQFEPKGFVNKNGSVSTGDHIHAEIKAAQGGVIASTTGGTDVTVGEGGRDELITPLKNGKLPGMDELIVQVQQMISVLKDHRDISDKILHATV
jgi:hypothetical protein